MREVGLKCIGFIGIPKVINQLAALRAAVDDDGELKSALPTEPRRFVISAVLHFPCSCVTCSYRKITSDELKPVQEAAYALWDDIYTPVSDKLVSILGQSHPDLPVFIIDSEYGPLFAPPHTFATKDALRTEPSWEVNRLRTSLVAIAGLRAQGGVGPQVTSHVWGLMKARNSISDNDQNKNGLQWLTSEEGALWAIRAIDGLCEAVEGSEEPEPRESKL